MTPTAGKAAIKALPVAAKVTVPLAVGIGVDHLKSRGLFKQASLFDLGSTIIKGKSNDKVKELVDKPFKWHDVLGGYWIIKEGIKAINRNSENKDKAKGEN